MYLEVSVWKNLDLSEYFMIFATRVNKTNGRIKLFPGKMFYARKKSRTCTPSLFEDKFLRAIMNFIYYFSHPRN